MDNKKHYYHIKIKIKFKNSTKFVINKSDDRFATQLLLQAGLGFDTKKGRYTCVKPDTHILKFSKIN